MSVLRSTAADSRALPAATSRTPAGSSTPLPSHISTRSSTVQSARDSICRAASSAWSKYTLSAALRRPFCGYTRYTGKCAASSPVTRRIDVYVKSRVARLSRAMRCKARAARIVQQRADVVHKVVARRAIDRPVVAQRLAARENLLDDDIRRALAQFR